MKFFARLRSAEERTRGNILFRYGWKITLLLLVGGRRLRRFSLLRHLGANVRHEKCRRNAGAKHRLRCRWKNLQPPCRRESSQGFAERSLAIIHRGGAGARGQSILRAQGD